MIYKQRQDPVQKKNVSTASSILDSSSQSESLQRKASLLNGVTQLARTKQKETDEAKEYVYWGKRNGLYQQTPSKQVPSGNEYIRREGNCVNNCLSTSVEGAKNATKDALGLAGVEPKYVISFASSGDNASKGVYEYYRTDEDPVKTVVYHNADENCVLTRVRKGSKGKPVENVKSGVLHYHAATTPKKTEKGELGWIINQIEFGKTVDKVQEVVSRAPGYDRCTGSCEHYLVCPNFDN